MIAPSMSVSSAGCSGCAGKIGIDRRTLCVHSALDLNSLLRTFRRYDSIHLRSAPFGSEERRDWEHRLVDAYTECGCDAGAVAFLTAIGFVFVRGLLSPQAFAWSTAAIALVFCFTMAIVGKIVGMACGRFRLRQLIRDLRPRLE